MPKRTNCGSSSIVGMPGVSASPIPAITRRIEGAVFSRRAMIATTIMTARRSRSTWMVAVMNGRPGAGQGFYERAPVGNRGGKPRDGGQVVHVMPNLRLTLIFRNISTANREFPIMLRLCLLCQFLQSQADLNTLIAAVPTVL